MVKTDTVKIGDKEYNKSEVTPSVYFNYVKGLKKKIDDEKIALVIDQALKMLNKCKITKQLDMAEEITHEVEVALRELDAAKKGFDIYVNREDIENYIENVEGKSIKIIELSRYTREIPDDKIDIIATASDIFDELYIVFTDYTGEVSKKVAKERRDKDPIVFGAFKDKRSTTTYIEDKLFFIADWVEEKCDLTLKQIVNDVKKSDKKDITYKVETPTDVESIKRYLESFKKENKND
jgi:hypothetical protein